MKLNKFSKINTGTKILKKKNGEIFIDKNFKINVDSMKNKKTLKIILKLVKSYFNRVKSSGIKIPNLIFLKIKSDKILCRMDYKGKNLIQKGLKFYNIKKFSKNIDGILDIIFIAKSKKIMLDPHIKNFVIDKNENVFYVDIYPPYSKNYQKLRQYFFKKNENEILINNFKYFYPRNLFYHFVSDIIKIDLNFEKNLNFFYEKLKRKKFILSNKKFFKKKVFEIANTEILRENKKYYLI